MKYLRTILAAVVALIISTPVFAGTIVVDEMSVRLSKSTAAQRGPVPYLMPYHPMRYRDAIPFDLKVEFMKFRFQFCGQTATAIDEYLAQATPVRYEHSIEIEEELVERQIPAECIIDVTGEDTKTGESVHHIVVLSTGGDTVFTNTGAVRYSHILVTTYRYYAMEMPLTPLLWFGVHE